MTKLLELGLVSVDGKVAKKSHRVKAGQTIAIRPIASESTTSSDGNRASPSAGAVAPTEDKSALLDENTRPYTILFEDDDLVVINKSAGATSHFHIIGYHC